ncbi:FAD-binding oxidoreductase [Streptomonospora nanhaiensis]|uniref:FAD-binding oxidoreductase n=1 Tax=Streptomonospora nanhaiensis TaxID=1323731 RepID=UPI001C37EC64|nr:FAD-binding oxidoreductase [Streptomonospora nanhaiensis]MBV2364163.1 FAD-binding oxidoreductase [Streptomonospora nanhaiensis]
MTTPTNDLIDRAAGALRAALSPDHVVTSGPAFDAARALWNGAVAHRPGVVVRAQKRADVAIAVRTAVDLGVPLTVRGGGHDWAGRALADRGITVDLTGMRRVSVDPVAQVARVEGGATSADLVCAAERNGLTAVTGTSGAVGLAGLSLGGGYGPLSGRFGLAADNILSATLVLADGSTVTASDTDEPELFWAVRGGGGNFGVVTSMDVRLHRVPGLLSGMSVYPWRQAPSVLHTLKDVLLGGPDELTVQVGVVAGPDGNPALFLAPTWSGGGDKSRAEGEKVLARLGALGQPLLAQAGPARMSDVLAGTDALFPSGRHVGIRTRTLPGLTSGVRSALLAQGEALPTRASAIALHALHGAATRVPAADTAFGNRKPHLMAEIIAVWEPGDEAAPGHRAWADALHSALAPEAVPGGYPNLLGPDDSAEIAHAYGPNTRRLLDAKQRYDPGRVFTATPLPPADR